MRISWNSTLGDISVKLPNGDCARVSSTMLGDDCIIKIEMHYNAAYGMGEKFNEVNQKGNEVVNRVFEKFCNQGNDAYCPATFFMTDTGLGLYVKTSYTTTFTFKDHITCHVPNGAEIILYSGNMQEILTEYIKEFGKVHVPPQYAFGPWISANHWNSEKSVYKQIENLKKFNFQATVIVLEAWSDETTFYIFHGAEYKPIEYGEKVEYERFDFSKSKYWNDPKKMIDDLHKDGMHLVLWQIPVYKNLNECDEGITQQIKDIDEAVKRRLCVMNSDGTPYTIPEGHWFSGSYIPDFTNDDTVKEWFSRRQYLLDIGVDGFKTDGGEFIYSDDTISNNGMTGKEAVNRYAQDYVNAYTDFMPKEHILFSRAGYSGASKTPILWAGDHISTDDELKHVFYAGMSAAYSGISFWGFDIGGFSGKLPSKDLYLRSTEFACFCPIMQYHSEPDGGQFTDTSIDKNQDNERSPWNIADGDEEYLEEIRYWYCLRMKLLPYIYRTAVESVEKGLTMMRPLALAYQNEFDRTESESSYMFGDALLISPLLESGQKKKIVYLPQGKWHGFFSHNKYTGAGYADSSAERFPVFIKEEECDIDDIPLE